MPVLTHRRRLAIATGMALVAGAVAAPAGHAAARSAAPAAQPPAATAKAPSGKRPHDDFNGDGYPDVAVGAPMAVLGDPDGGAGAVSVLFGGPEGLSSAHKQVLTWPDRPGITNPGTPATARTCAAPTWTVTGTRISSAASGRTGPMATRARCWRSTGEARPAFRPTPRS